MLAYSNYSDLNFTKCQPTCNSVLRSKVGLWNRFVEAIIFSAKSCNNLNSIIYLQYCLPIDTYLYIYFNYCRRRRPPCYQNYGGGGSGPDVANFYIMTKKYNCPQSCQAASNDIIVDLDNGRYFARVCGTSRGCAARCHQYYTK